MKTILLLPLLLCTLPCPARQTKGNPSEQPEIKVRTDYFYISENNAKEEKRDITLFLHFFLKGNGTFTEQEGPHQLTLSDPEGSWSVPLDTGMKTDQHEPLAAKLSQMRLPSLNPGKGIKNWCVRLTSPPFHLPPSTTKFRIRGHLVFYLARQIHTLPPFNLLQEGKGRTQDIPLPSPEQREGDLAFSDTPNTATFTSSTPSSGCADMTLKYDPSRFQFAQFLLVDKKGKAAEATPARFSFNFNNQGHQEYIFNRQYYSKQDWNLLQVKLFYINPEEMRRVAVPVDMEIDLARKGPPVRHSRQEFTILPAPSPVPFVHDPRLPEEKVRFGLHYFHQNQGPGSSGHSLVYDGPFTRIDFQPETPENGPVAISISPENPLTVRGNETSPPVFAAASSHMSFSPWEKEIPIPILSLNIPDLLPETSSCWTLSGTANMIMASRACRISFPLPTVMGSTVTLPLQDIPGIKLPDDAKTTLTVTDMKSESSRSSLLLHVRSTLPSACFGSLTLIDANNREYSPAEPVVHDTHPQGVTRIYEPYWEPGDRNITAELIIYINPRTVRVPLNLKFGAGGMVPSPPSE